MERVYGISTKISWASLVYFLYEKTLIYYRDTSQSIDGSPVYQFEMSALNDHLRNQGELNKTASYFNVDILKYQVNNTQALGQVFKHSIKLTL